MKPNENSDLKLRQDHPIAPLPTSLCSSSHVVFPALAANKPDIKVFQGKALVKDIKSKSPLGKKEKGKENKFDNLT